MAAIDDLVIELERSYRELQDRMSDPAVYNDHREAAEVGRRLKELEEPHRLAREWSQTRTDLEEARADGDLKELVPELEARLAELERAKQQAELDATRRSQIGSGERAEKIRTYNFPESRVTDHRIKLTVHQLDRVLEGGLDEFTEGLDAEGRRRALGE